MKRFTIIFSILLVLGFAGTLVYVGMSEDFINPAEAAQMGADMDSPIWTMTMEDVLSELEGQGLIDRSTAQLLASGGLCSDAQKVSGAEFYWWDLENLDESSQEYAAYKQLQEEGFIDLYGSGYIMNPVPNGPFAVLLSFYEGDVDALDKAFRALGQSGSGAADDPDAPVWSMTMDDLLDYMEEKGFLDRASMLPLSGGVATEAYVSDNVEYYWWDVENLAEGSNEAAAYQNILDGEPIDLYQQGQNFMTVTKNGPFAIFYSYYTGDTNALLAAFEAFGRE